MVVALSQVNPSVACEMRNSVTDMGYFMENFHVEFYNAECLEEVEIYLIGEHPGAKTSHPDTGLWISQLAKRGPVLVFIEGCEAEKEITDEGLIQKLYEKYNIHPSLREAVKFYGWDAPKTVMQAGNDLLGQISIQKTFCLLDLRNKEASGELAQYLRNALKRGLPLSADSVVFAQYQRYFEQYQEASHTFEVSSMMYEEGSVKLREVNDKLRQEVTRIMPTRTQCMITTLKGIQKMREEQYFCGKAIVIAGDAHLHERYYLEEFSLQSLYDELHHCKAAIMTPKDFQKGVAQHSLDEIVQSIDMTRGTMLLNPYVRI